MSRLHLTSCEFFLHFLRGNWAADVLGRLPAHEPSLTIFRSETAWATLQILRFLQWTGYNTRESYKSVLHWLICGLSLVPRKDSSTWASSMLKQEDTYTHLVEVNQAIYTWSLRHRDKSKSVVYSLKYMTHPLNLMGISISLRFITYLIIKVTQLPCP